MTLLRVIQNMLGRWNTLHNTPSELYLADNRLSPEDGAHLRVLISLSNTLSLLDLRNNNLQVSHFKARNNSRFISTKSSHFLVEISKTRISENSS